MDRESIKRALEEYIRVNYIVPVPAEPSVLSDMSAKQSVPSMAPMAAAQATSPVMMTQVAPEEESAKKQATKSRKRLAWPSAFKKKSPILPTGAKDVCENVEEDFTVGSVPVYEELEPELQRRMEHLSDTFQEYLFFLIESKGMTNAEVHKRALVDKKVFSKIKNNPDYHPKKLTALCLCVGVMLNLDETKDLLARAGYALSPCDKTDIIFSFFIENQIYDMIEIDIQLEEHGLPCIVS